METIRDKIVKPHELTNNVYAKIAGLIPDWYYKPRSWERAGNGFIYKALGIELIKDFIPTGGDRKIKKKRKIDPNYHTPTFTFKKPSFKEMQIYERYTRIHETTHMLASILGTGLTGAFFMNNNLALVLASGIYTLGNIYPVMLQRYNRERMYRLMEKANRIGNSNLNAR